LLMIFQNTPELITFYEKILTCFFSVQIITHNDVKYQLKSNLRFSYSYARKKRTYFYRSAYSMRIKHVTFFLSIKWLIIT